jgi:hypothetical protein
MWPRKTNITLNSPWRVAEEQQSPEDEHAESSEQVAC